LGCFTLIAIRHSYFVSARVGFRRTFGAIMHQPTLPTNEECVGTLNREVVHLLNVLFFSNSTHNTSAAPRLANMGTHPELPRPHPAALGCVEGVLGRRGDRLGVDGQVFEHGVVVDQHRGDRVVARGLPGFVVGQDVIADLEAADRLRAKA